MKILARAWNGPLEHKPEHALELALARAFAGGGDGCVLSCDVFDTALYRVVARPADVWVAAGLRAAAAGAISCNAAAFAVHRQAAEQRARAAAEQAGHDEVRIAEIYDMLAACGVVSDTTQAVAAEFAAERAACRPVAPFQRALARARAAAPGLRVVFVSDTAWRAADIALLLEQCGYGAACDVITSADHRRSKHTGRLFGVVMARMACEAAQMLHVGDNEQSDGAQARAHGIAACVVKRPWAAGVVGVAGVAEPVTRLALSTAGVAAAMAPAPVAGPAADGRRLGLLAAPLFLGFALFILRQARALGVKRIYFLARDGDLPRALCQALLDGRGAAVSPLMAGPAPELIYLHVSRAALKDREASHAYLTQIGYMDPVPRLLVDVGWNGSQQQALAALCTASTYGAYLGLWAGAMLPGFGPPQARGYLFDFGAPADIAALTRESYIIFEMMFSAADGTVLGYEKGPQGAWAPVLDAEAGVGGDTRRAAHAAFSNTVLDIARDVGRLIGGAWPAAMDPAAALAPLRALLETPSRDDVAWINRIPFIASGARLLPAVNPIPLHELLLFPARSLRRLRRSPWRAGATRAALRWGGMDFATLEDRARRVGLDIGKKESTSF